MGVSSNHVLRPRARSASLTINMFLFPASSCCFYGFIVKVFIVLYIQNSQHRRIVMEKFVCDEFAFVRHSHLKQLIVLHNSIYHRIPILVVYLQQVFFHTILFILCFDFLKVPKNRIYTCGIYAVKYNNNIS